MYLFLVDLLLSLDKKNYFDPWFTYYVSSLYIGRQYLSGLFNCSTGFHTMKFQGPLLSRHLLWTHLKFVYVLSLNSDPLISVFWICLLNLITNPLNRNIPVVLLDLTIILPKFLEFIKLIIASKLD